ncbi:hypothetical protein ACWIGW_42420 [Nocardia brasiliensis]
MLAPTLPATAVPAGGSVLESVTPRADTAAAAFSGCAQISDPLGYTFVQTTISAGDGDLTNMYGPQRDPRDLRFHAYRYAFLGLLV